MLFNLAGGSFRPKEAKEVIYSLDVGDEVVLVRDPENEYDANAIKVMGIVSIPTGDLTAADYHEHIGFVERTIAERLAPLMDADPQRSWRAVVRMVHAEGTAKLKPLLETI